MEDGGAAADPNTPDAYTNTTPPQSHSPLFLPWLRTGLHGTLNRATLQREPLCTESSSEAKATVL